MSSTIDVIENEKVEPETQTVVKVEKSKCDFCGRSKSQIFTK